jgi:hypothetical protein
MWSILTRPASLHLEKSTPLGLTEGAVTSIVQFISGPIFDAADVQLMSDAYDKAIEDVYSFGRPNAIVEAIMATRIINLTKGGERDSNRLREKALAACGFNLHRAGRTDG